MDNLLSLIWSPKESNLYHTKGHTSFFHHKKSLTPKIHYEADIESDDAAKLQDGQHSDQHTEKWKNKEHKGKEKETATLITRESHNSAIINDLHLYFFSSITPQFG